MSHHFEALKAHILPLSESDSFETARCEWILEYVEVSEEFDFCPCGQEIKEHCYIRNSKTGQQTYVGNVCVNQFIGIDTGTLFDGLKRLKSNPQANANLAVIEYAEKRGYLFENEPRFLRQTMRKRLLTKAQLAWKEKINRRVLSHTVVKKRTKR